MSPLPRQHLILSPPPRSTPPPELIVPPNSGGRNAGGSSGEGRLPQGKHLRRDWPHHASSPPEPQCTETS
eukprot:scaffold228_cov312-Pinguiococcus_pyrenoidosus.AAC.1